MARAYKCDICGKLYERFEIEIDYSLLQIYNSKTGNTNGKYLDLCPDCQERLDRFARLNIITRSDQNE